MTREGVVRQPPRLREPKRQAGGFEKVREAHQTELAEDYVELIAARIAPFSSRPRGGRWPIARTPGMPWYGIS